MQAPRPAVRRQQPDHRLEVCLHVWRHVGPFDLEVLVVRRAVDQHLAGAVVAIGVVALPRPHLLGPALEVLELLLRLLREQVVGDAHGELAVAVQLLDDLIVLGVVLEATAGVDHAGHAEPVHLAHEVPRRVLLILGRQLRPLGERGVEDGRVRLRDQQSGRFAARAAHDLSAREVRRVLGVADGANRGAVQQRAIVEMQQEHRRIRGESR